MNRVRSLREEIGMTQKELAARLGVKAVSGVSKYESGATPLHEETLRLLSIIFDVSTDYILGISDIKKVNQPKANKKYAWDTMYLIENANALSDEDRSLLLSCAKSPELLELIGRFKELSPRSQRRANEYIQMLKIVDDSKTENLKDL